ncbi:MAG: hypothetical protein ACOX5G_09930 [Kiritimatiellia bacterium]|jgi:hypothetical protein
MQIRSSGFLRPAARGLALLALPASAALTLHTPFLVPGETAKAEYVWEGGAATLRVFAAVETDVPLKRGADPASETKVLEKKLDGAATNAVAFAVGPMVAGRVRFRAEVSDAGGMPLLRETTPWAEVSIRRRIDLSGEWRVAKVEPFPVQRDGGAPDYAPDAFPAAMALPGTIAGGAWPRGFRGWITLARTVELPGGGAPLFVSAEGVADSVALRVNGEEAAEMLPEEDLDSSLSHWSYFHGERLYPGIKGREDARRLARLLWDRDVLRDGLKAIVPPVPGGKTELELVLRATSGSTRHQPPYGIHGDVTVSPLPPVYVEGIDFDTSKPGDLRRFAFSVRLANTTGKPFKGRLRAVYGQYAGATPYTGACPATDETVRDLAVPAGGCTVVVERDEVPRFATCRATFVLQEGRTPVDAASADYHAVTVEIRDRRDMYVNNERFFAKGRGSSSASPNQVWQFLANGTNMRRGMDVSSWPRFPGLASRAAFMDAQLPAGILFDSGPVLASCEKCTFWNPDDTRNVERAVRYQIRTLAACPGLIQWEATNELFGEPEEARALICDLFRELDPYHRPVVMTKGGGEWEALARDGTVSGPDIVGVQYLGTREAIDALTATITEKPIQSTEINWNDPVLHRDGLWRYGLDRGVCGMLLFDYSGNSTDQAVTAIPPANLLPDEWNVVARAHREMYLDLECTARRLPDGRIAARFANRMPYALRDLSLAVRDGGRTRLPELAPGDACEFAVPASAATAVGGEPNPWIVATASYTTHGGLKNECAMAAEVPRP